MPYPYCKIVCSLAQLVLLTEHITHPNTGTFFTDDEVNHDFIDHEHRKRNLKKKKSGVT